MQFQVDWDKVEGKNGDSYLHIPHLLKNLLDLYERKKAIVFKDRKPSHVTRDDWLDHEDTPFFLTSSGHAFSKIDLSATSEAMGTPINARDVRKIVSTWAQSHRQEDIRRSEEYALNHGQRVAQDRYLVNKQLPAQLLTQQLVSDEGLLSSDLAVTISSHGAAHAEEIAIKEKELKKKMDETQLKKSRGEEKKAKTSE